MVFVVVVIGIVLYLCFFTWLQCWFILLLLFWNGRVLLNKTCRILTQTAEYWPKRQSIDPCDPPYVMFLYPKGLVVIVPRQYFYCSCFVLLTPLCIHLCCGNLTALERSQIKQPAPARTLTHVRIHRHYIHRSITRLFSLLVMRSKDTLKWAIVAVWPRGYKY